MAPLLRSLRERSIKVGVLSNTMWPRALHERVFRRDGVLELIDGAVYSSEIPWTKPHPEAFRAAMAAIGVTDPASCVFVGDRPFDDIYGAARLGMRAVLIPHSDLPPYDGAVPDAVITRLAELPGLLDRWLEERVGPGVEPGVEQPLQQPVEQSLEQGLEQGLERPLEQGLEQGLERPLEQR